MRKSTSKYKSSKHQNANQKFIVTMEPNIKKSQKGQKRQRRVSSDERAYSKKKKSSTDKYAEGTLEDLEEQGTINITEFAVGSKPRPKIRKRILQQRVQSKARKPYYDEKDRAALRLMTK